VDELAEPVSSNSSKVRPPSLHRHTEELSVDQHKDIALVIDVQAYLCTVSALDVPLKFQKSLWMPQALWQTVRHATLVLSTVYLASPVDDEPLELVLGFL
jgi:hypothetical protein